MTENINPRHNMSRKSKKQEAELNAGLEPEPTPAELPPEPIGQLPETFEPEPPVPSALDGDLDALMGEIDDDGAFGIIKRRRADEGELKYLARWNLSQISLENIKNQFGGGSYDVAIRNRAGQLLRRAKFTIDEVFKGKLEQGGQVNALAEMSRGNRTDPMLPLMMQMMQQQQAQQMQMMQAMMSSNAQIISAVMGRSNGGGGGIPPELLKVLLDKSSPESTIRMMRDLKELMPEGGGSEREEEGFMGKLMSAAPAVISALAGGAAAQRGVVSPQQRLAPPQPVTVAEPAPPAPDVVVPMPAPNAGMLPPEIKSLLVKAAERGADESLYADLVIDQIAMGDDIGELQKLLADDATYHAIVGEIPAPLMPWFQRLREIICEPEEEEPEDPAPAPAPAPVPAAVTKAAPPKTK